MIARVRSLLVLAILLGGAATASAQTPPPGGDERPTMRIGPFELRPRLLFNNIGVDNNVFNEPENPKRDFTFGAQPDLEITVRPGPLRIVWLSGSDFVWYQTYKSERMVNRSSNVTVDLDLKLLRPFFTFVTADTSARPSPEIDARARRHPRTLIAGATLKLATRTSLSGQWSESKEAYDEGQDFRGVELAETLNRTAESVSGSIALQLTPLTAVSLVAGKEDLRFAEAPLRNSTSTHISPTVTFSPAGLINGRASIGYKRVRGVDPALPEFKGLAMNGSVSVLLGLRYRVETQFTRDVQYSYEETLPYYVLTGARATVATQLNNLLDFRLTGGQNRMRYRAYSDAESPGLDRQNVYGAGIGFRLGDRRRFVIQAEWTERDSDRDSLREFKNHRIFGTLTWGA